MLWIIMSLACEQSEKRLEAYAEMVCDLHSDCETTSTFGFETRSDCIEHATTYGEAFASDKDTFEACIDELAQTDCSSLYDSSSLPDCWPQEIASEEE